MAGSVISPFKKYAPVKQVLQSLLLKGVTGVVGQEGGLGANGGGEGNAACGHGVSNWTAKEVVDGPMLKDSMGDSLINCKRTQGNVMFVGVAGAGWEII